MLTVFFMAFVACNEEETSKKDTSSTLDTSNNAVSEDYPNTMEEYISSYCSVYSMRCGYVYASQEECERDIAAMWGDKECEVTDPAMLQECIDWLSDFPCDETGWDPSCDGFYVCE